MYANPNTITFFNFIFYFIFLFSFRFYVVFFSLFYLVIFFPFSLRNIYLSYNEIYANVLVVSFFC